MTGAETRTKTPEERGRRIDSTREDTIMSEATTGAVSAVPAEGPGRWIAELGPKEKRTLGALRRRLGARRDGRAALQLRDPDADRHLGVTRAEAGALGTAALLTSAIGGWLAGFLADPLGAVRTLQIASCGLPASPSCRASRRASSNSSSPAP